VKPDRLAERIEDALTERDPLRAMLVMSELQVDTVDLAPPGPNVDRARRWLREVVAVLREASDSRGFRPATDSLIGDDRGEAKS